MGRTPCCEKVGLKKGPWTPEEDQKLLAYVEQHGHGSWRALPAKAGLQRCGKSCRLRWTNYLRPDIKRGKFSLQEEQTIVQLHALLGNRWSAIATHLPMRTDNEIKNYWNTRLKKQLTKMGIDPTTHKPRVMALGNEQAKDAANLSHMTQWENARLEAETRLVRKSRLVTKPCNAHFINSPVSPYLRPQPLCLDVLKAWQGMMWCKQSISGNLLDSPTSTLNSSENGLAPLPTVGLTDNQFPSSDQGPIMKENNSLDEWKSLGNSSDIPEIFKTEGEVHDMMYQDNCLMEAFADILAGNNDDKGSSDGDFEENKNCWSSVLNNLVNCSPLGSLVL